MWRTKIKKVFIYSLLFATSISSGLLPREVNDGDYNTKFESTTKSYMLTEIGEYETNFMKNYIIPFQNDPGGSCRQVTTGGGCFQSSITAGQIHAAHQNGRYVHNVTAATPDASSTSMWHSPSHSLFARAQITAWGGLNRSFWDIRR